MQIVLQDILGYPIKEINYESGNVEFQFANSEGKNVLCFEVKGTSTRDLFAPQHRAKKEHETPIKQTWDYMGSIGLDYGICTNYKDFVLITKQFGYSKYHFFDFNSIKGNDEKLKEFIGIFSKERIIEKGFVEKLQKESVVEEREFTKEFYKLYHETRLMLIKAFQEKQRCQKTEAIYYTQLLLNRLIFIFFVEDRGFVPDKQLFTKRILHSLESGQFTEHSRKIYDDIKELFIAFDKGSKVLGVFGFNGSLFSGVMPEKVYFTDLKEDKFFSDVKQNSKLSKSTKLNQKASDIIKKHPNLNPIISNLLILDSFDFNTEVNVNILGHIFEQSISDLEELKQEGISRRKKEGVFYTPEYITDYICRNTIIPYLSKSGVTSVHDLIDEYKDNIEELEKKFREIKILDPACGSGAFLVKAVDVLLEIHKEIQNRKNTRKYSGEQLQITHEWDENKEIRRIIENNIYGVDINPESIDITKLSLFLKLASSERKLIGLSKNIKVGNSVIDDKLVDNRAFSWSDEFPEILSPLIPNRGFDIVIGNPPYVRQERLTEIKPYLEKSYQSYAGTADLYVYFLEKGLTNLKNDGYFGVIVSNKWSKATYGESLRRFLVKFKILRFIDFGDLPVFADATTYPCILLIKKSPSINNNILISKIDSLEFTSLESKILDSHFELNQTYLTEGSWNFDEPAVKKIYAKIKSAGIPLEEYCKEKINFGLKTGLDEAFVIDEKKKIELEKMSPSSKEIIKPFLIGKQIKRYTYDWQDKYILLVKKGTDIEKFPSILNYLKQFKNKLSERTDIKGKGEWFELRTCTYYDDFLKPKIIFAHFGKRPQFTFDTNNFYLNPKSYILPTQDKYLLGILNSSAIAFYSQSICPYVRGEFYEYGKQYVNQFPIPDASSIIKERVTELVNSLLDLHAKFLEKKKTVLNRIKNELNLENLPMRLNKFYTLGSNEFLAEIKKLSKSDISLIKLDEWEQYFNKYKKEVTSIVSDIENKDKEINEIVYALFGINDKERKIIESTLHDVAITSVD
jgi:hypothetical protein